MPASSRPLTIVTGGSRGIGAATAVHLAGLGHDIVLGYLGDRAAAEHVVESVVVAGGRALAVPGDVADEDDVTRLFAAPVW